LSFSNDTKTTHIYLKNTGQTLLDPSKFDVYIDGIRIPRNDSNRTIEVLADTDTINLGILDPKEGLHIQVFGDIREDVTHEVTVTTQYETRDSDFFSP
jgi:archaellum component FlaF (FlaF/FlaG flagellin family)